MNQVNEDMEASINISIVLGGILSLLFSLIAYFARQLHSDVKKMELNLAEIKISTELIKANMQSESTRTSERMAQHERRIQQLENYLLNPAECERR